MPHIGEMLQNLADGVMRVLQVKNRLIVGDVDSGRKATFSGAGDTRVVVRDNTAGKAVNLGMSYGGAGAGNAGIGFEGVGALITLNGGTNAVGFQGQTIGTGAAVPTLSLNKPGANSGVATWLTININGTDYYLPLWS